MTLDLIVTNNNPGPVVLKRKRKPSNVQIGAYYKGRSKKWLEARGWQVADLEIVRWIFAGDKGRIPVKRDQFGADLLAVNKTGVAFIQVKGGQSASGGTTFPEAQRIFQSFIWPVRGTARIILAWTPRARSPRVIRCE